MDFENTLMDAPAEMQDNKNELGVLTEASRYDAEACIRLANMYSTGDGVETNLIDAIHWYRYAIRQFGKTEYEKDVMELMKLLVDHEIPIHKIEMLEPNLEDSFLEVVRK